MIFWIHTGNNKKINKMENIDNSVVENLQREEGENTENILTKESTQRFSSAVWYKKIQTLDIIIAGLGGIGSWTALLIGRLCPASITLFDNDKIELANLAGQLFDYDDIDEYKAIAVCRKLQRSLCHPNALTERYTRDSMKCPVMICGFDNMTARKIFFDNWTDYVIDCKEENRKECLFIDGRLTADELQVFCITGDDIDNIKRYKNEFLFSDDEAEHTICSFKQTAFMANMIAGFITNE